MPTNFSKLIFKSISAISPTMPENTDKQQGTLNKRKQYKIRGATKIFKKYLKISRKFLTLTTSQLMTPYRETNIAKKKKNLSSIVIAHVKLASQLKKESEFGFSFLWQEHYHVRSSVHGYASMLASQYYFDKTFTAHFQPAFTFQSMNSNIKVECQRCSRLIKKTLLG